MGTASKCEAGIKIKQNHTAAHPGPGGKVSGEDHDFIYTYIQPNAKFSVAQSSSDTLNRRQNLCPVTK